jgi:acetylornithine deacetylase/succinyl-diaminopimelate desuccinylase-like protein
VRTQRATPRKPKSRRPATNRARIKRPNPRGATNTSAFLRRIQARTRCPEFTNYLKQLLLELCRIDTTPRTDINEMRQAEEKCFQILERELGQLSFSKAKIERRPINPSIQSHPNYSLLHFTKTATRPQGLSPEEVYAQRGNLVFVAPGKLQQQGGESVALNAHIDVVAPYFPPRANGRVVYGRGACDDKGPVVSVFAALKVLSEAMQETGQLLNRNIVAMFVVEEETGGNGSLSLAIDRDLKRLYDMVLVGECTGLKIYPANRGAVWYRAELNAPEGTSNLEMSAFVIEELEKEGVALRAESRHPLFPQRPVQTCHGIIGRFGEHPSRICGEVCFELQFESSVNSVTESLVEDCLEAGLAGYVGFYGDKTKVKDPSTGKPLVPKHYALRRNGKGFQINVYGSSGHMGSIRERDGAITKMAHLIRSLLFSKQKLEAASGTMRLWLTDNSFGSHPAETLVLEGGQGFVPTHTIEEVMQRLRRAAERGAENYLRQFGRGERGTAVVKMTYEKLHNVAFDGDPTSVAMRQAIAAAKQCRIWKNEPILGWTVSCDARLFATEYPGMPVLTFGPGQLGYAHSDREQIALEEIRAAVEFLAIFLFLQTGSV